MTILHEYIVEQENVNDEFAIVTHLVFQTGDKVEKGEKVAQVEYSKSAVDIVADASGYIQYAFKENDEVPVGKRLFIIVERKEDISINSQLERDSAKVSEENAIPMISKKAQALMASHGISTSDLKKTAFISEKEVLDYIAKMEKRNENSIVESLSATKRIEINMLKDIHDNGLCSTLHIALEIAPLYTSLKKNRLGSVSFLPYTLSALTTVLPQYPKLNAYFSEGEIVIYKACRLGLALDLNKGLKVITLPDLSDLSIPDIEATVLELSIQYVKDELSKDMLQGSTFTVTDLSGLNLHSFSPLILKNQSAILGISGYSERSGTCIVSLSFDHRVTEGKYAGQFLNTLKQEIEAFNEALNVDVRCMKCNTVLTDIYLECIHNKERSPICLSCVKGLVSMHAI